MQEHLVETVITSKKANQNKLRRSIQNKPNIE
jgi:hypothetical protein